MELYTFCFCIFKKVTNGRINSHLMDFHGFLICWLFPEHHGNVRTTRHCSIHPSRGKFSPSPRLLNMWVAAWEFQLLPTKRSGDPIAWTWIGSVNKDVTWGHFMVYGKRICNYITCNQLWVYYDIFAVPSDLDSRKQVGLLSKILTDQGGPPGVSRS